MAVACAVGLAGCASGTSPFRAGPTTTAPSTVSPSVVDAAVSDSVAPITPVAPAESAAPLESAPPGSSPDPGTAASPTDTGLSDCPATSRAAVADKAAQRFWLCADGRSITDALPMTTASAGYGLPPVGTYEVFARDELSFGAHGERLNRFVAFYTTPRGNRIAFHEVVNQDPATIGDLDQRGQSAGCFRVSESDSWRVWEFLQVGDPVVVITN